MLLVDAMLKLHPIELGLLDYQTNGDFTKKRIALKRHSAAESPGQTLSLMPRVARRGLKLRSVS
jgi:hypothetical protein